MNASMRLARLEIRRNLGLWLFLPLTAMTVWVANGFLNATIWLWPDTSFAIRNSVILLGPIVGALAAWMAGRDRRNALDELLSSTPRPPVNRMLANWMGSATWGVLIFAATGLSLGAVTAWNVTWGGPDLSPIAAGFMTILAYSAIGFAVGTWIPLRITAPLIGSVLFVAQASTTYTQSTINHLSPIAFADSVTTEVFFEIRSDFYIAQIVWLLGLGATALAVALLRRHAQPIIYGMAILSMIVAVSGTITALRVDGLYQRGTTMAYTPICEDRGVPVCLHPAYGPMLSETADIIGRLTAPLVGLPDAPGRAEQVSFRDVTLEDFDGDTLTFELLNTARDPAVYALGGYNALANILVRDLVNIERNWHPPDLTAPEQRPKEVMGNWLLIQADIPLEEHIDEFRSAFHGFQLDKDQEVALERFTELDDTQRRAWLKENWSALRAGHLTLADLP